MIHTIICKYCNIEFSHKDHRTIYCSPECSLDGRFGAEVLATCPECDKEFSLRGDNRKKFCSRPCAIQNRTTTKQISYCVYCDKVLLRKDVKYCSGSCQGKYQRSQYLEKWFSGNVSGNTGGEYVGLSGYVRSYLLEEAEYQCSKCGWGEVHPDTGNIPLQINHIDGNSLNSSPNNLEVICPNCHSLTSNYGSLNMGNGRSHRRKNKE